ncbi:MAG: hypothetical protein U0Z44_19995 [Kouleothrix sp.]
MLNPAYGFAARRPLALLLLLVALAAGLTVALWLLPLGLAAYGAVVYLLARDPALVTLAQRPAHACRARPFTLPRHDRAHPAGLGRSVGRAGGALARLLAPIGDQARELLSQAYLLCDKARSSKATWPAAIRALHDQIRAIDRQLAAAGDSYTRQQVEQTRQALSSASSYARDLRNLYRPDRRAAAEYLGEPRQCAGRDGAPAHGRRGRAPTPPQTRWPSA